MGDVQNVNSGLNGDYALATPLNAATDFTTPASWVPLGTDGSGNAQNAFNGFAGIFEGLGNTISNLTVNIGANRDAGLFGYSNGTIRDIGLIGGSVSGGGLQSADWLARAARHDSNAYATGESGHGQLCRRFGRPQCSPRSPTPMRQARSVAWVAMSAVWSAQRFRQHRQRLCNGRGQRHGQLYRGLAGLNLVGPFQRLRDGRGERHGQLCRRVGRFQHSGAIANGYWDTQTSGQSAGIGYDIAQAINPSAV